MNPAPTSCSWAPCLRLAAAAASLLAAAAPTAQCPAGPVFGPQVSIPVFASGLRCLAAADLDGDGDLDLAAGGRPDGLVVLRNDGPAGFVAQPVVPLPDLPNGIATGDFDGDGLVDVATCGVSLTTTAVATNLQGAIDVLLNRTPAGGPVAFATPRVLPVGANAPNGSAGTALVAADLDADGVLDFAMTDVNSPNVWVLLGQGIGGRPLGSWGAPTPFPVFTSFHTDLEAADFDQDGVLDLAAVSFGDGSLAPGAVTLLRGLVGASGQPLGAFASAGRVPFGVSCTALAVRDLDADGFLDLAVTQTQGVTVARGTGGFGVAAPVATALRFGEDIAAVDLDGDGRLDLCVPRSVNRTDPGGNFAVLRDLGAGFIAQGFDFGRGYPGDVAIGDFDGDGIPDVAIGKHTGMVTIARGTCPTTGAAVGVVAPNGGEMLAVGSQFAIDWVKSPSVAAVDVELSRDGGRTWQVLAAGATTNPLAWRVSAPSTNRALVRVHPTGSTALEDRSNATFVITGPGLAMATPFGAGCGAPPPEFAASVPHLGADAELDVRGAAPNAIAGFFASLPAAAPLPIGGGCTVFLDLGTLGLLASDTTDAQGNAAGLLRVPANPALLGQRFDAQALVVGLGAAPVRQLTNAVDLRIGL